MARIMVVEDNALNIKLFCDLLNAHGHDTRPVTDSREALDTARAFDPDLVITDIQLPHVDGMELMRTIRSDDKPLCQVPIMAVTAYAGEGDDERIRKAGAQAYVSKPISVIRFVEAVEKLLAEGRLPDQCDDDETGVAAPEEAAASEAEAEAGSDADAGQDESGPETGAASREPEQDEADPSPDQPPLI